MTTMIRMWIRRLRNAWRCLRGERPDLQQRIAEYLEDHVPQHLSGIHPQGGRVPPAEPVNWLIAKPGGIVAGPVAGCKSATNKTYYPPPTETQQRWAAAIAASRDERHNEEESECPSRWS